MMVLGVVTASESYEERTLTVSPFGVASSSEGETRSNMFSLTRSTQSSGSNAATASDLSLMDQLGQRATTTKPCLIRLPAKSRPLQPE